MRVYIFSSFVGDKRGQTLHSNQTAIQTIIKQAFYMAKFYTLSVKHRTENIPGMRRMFVVTTDLCVLKTNPFALTEQLKHCAGWVGLLQSMAIVPRPESI